MPETGASPLLPPSRAAELRTIGSHAGVVLVGQLAVMAFGVTDTVVAGRYSETALAALAVGTAVYISVYVGLMGILQALLPVWAELHGSRRNAVCAARCEHDSADDSLLNVQIDKTAHAFTPLRSRCSLMACS